MVPFYLAAAAQAGSQLRGHRSETGPLSFCRSHEQIIKQAIYQQLGNVAEVERIFPIIKAQDEY